MSKNLVGAFLALFLVSVAVPTAFAETPATPTTNTPAVTTGNANAVNAVNTNAGNTDTPVTGTVNVVTDTTGSANVVPAQANSDGTVANPGDLTNEELGDTIDSMVTAFQGKETLIGFGFMLMLFCFGTRKVLEKLKRPISGKAMPWVAFGLSAVASTGFGLANGQGVLEIVVTAVTAAFMSMGSFDTVKAVASAVKPSVESADA